MIFSRGGGVKIYISLSETKSVNHAIKKFKADFAREVAFKIEI